MVDLDYKDTIQIVETGRSTDGYATETVIQIVDVAALFISNTGQQHTNYQDDILSDAEVYLDPADDYVVENFNRLEGQLIIASRFGSDDDESWYRVTEVIVGEDKLLTNEIDNVKCLLKKSTKIDYVS